MAITTTAVLVAAAVATAVGAGISAYGQYQAGKTQSAIADYNARQQQIQAKQQAASMQVQAAMLKQEAEANMRLREAEAKAMKVNAKNLENQALTQDSIDRANMANRRQEFAKLQATQRAQIAASGVVESSGTPLDLLAETAARIQQDRDQQQFTTELQRRTLFAEAANERLGGELALAGATLERDSALATAALQDASSRGVLMAGMSEARITRAAGRAARQAGAYGAVATLFSGLGQSAGIAASAGGAGSSGKK